ncbi:MAG: HEAT repeat domain-containing protein [Planctomycetota bacterium]|jgi:hypothetical protein
MLRHILLNPALLVLALYICGCAAPKKTVYEMPAPITKHETYRGSVSTADRKSINELIKQLNDPKTVLLRDPGNPLSFQSEIIDKLVAFGEKAIPALQKEYVKLKELEREIARKLGEPAGGGVRRDALMERRYALRTRRYALMQPLYRVDHEWNARFFAVELCSHFDHSIRGFSSDELDRGDIAIRQRAAEYLYKHGNDKYLCNLVWAINDEDPEVVLAAVTALRRITKQDFGLIDSRSDETKYKAMYDWWEYCKAYMRLKRK